MCKEGLGGWEGERLVDHLTSCILILSVEVSEIETSYSICVAG